jgi:hypothetical protein
MNGKPAITIEELMEQAKPKLSAVPNIEQQQEVKPKRQYNKKPKPAQEGGVKKSTPKVKKTEEGQQAEKPVSENVAKSASQKKTEIDGDIKYKALYVKMILQDIPDNALISGDITIKQIIYSIVGGQRPIE